MLLWLKTDTILRQMIGIMIIGVAAIVAWTVKVAGGTAGVPTLTSMVYIWEKAKCLLQELIGTIGKMTGDPSSSLK